SASYNMPWTPPGVDNLKLRLASGMAGNRGPGKFKYTFLTQGPENGIVGLRPPATAGPPPGKPGGAAETGGGVGQGVLHGRAQADVSIYSKKTTGLVLTAAPAPSSGFTTQIVNGGSLTNKGVEMGLNLLAVQTSNFTWQSHTTFSHNRGLVTSLPVPAFF